MLRQYELRLITQAAACQILRVSPATFFRYLKKLGEGGIEALKHGNTGKRPHNRMEESQRSRIVDLISTKYCDFQP
ncbi:helix-turn-helix domain-containing protein, partial [uncultured Parasutterella sp.]